MNTPTGLQLLTAQDIINFATMTNNPISTIKQDKNNDEFISDDKYSYRVLHKNDIDEAIFDWFKGMGDGAYFLTDFFKKDANQVIDSLGHHIIKDTAKFLKDARDYIDRDYKDYKDDYSSCKEYLQAQHGLTIEDLLDIEKIWNSEILFIGSSSNFEDEMLPNIKQYGVNDEAIYGELCGNFLHSFDILGDYGRGGRYYSDDLVFFKKDC